MFTKVGFILTTLFITSIGLNASYGQISSSFLKNKIEQDRHARIMFYNCENLFDYIDDTLKNDEEFLPDGIRYWNKYKYYQKLNKITKVITAVGGWTPVDIIGLCEIENDKTLYDLTHNTSLYLQEYKYLHKESADKRGIDVALLYQAKTYRPIKTKYIALNFIDNPEKKSRDILYSKGLLHKTDTVHIFVNHWPSRWGGQLQSESARIFAASILKQKTDSIFEQNSKANIIIMGDFNDDPENTSIKKTLSAKHDTTTLQANELYNLNIINKQKENKGTHKYQGNWGMLDQFIISGNLLNKNEQLFTMVNNFCVFNAAFLLENDENFLGKKPFRTFIGYKYNAGYSDHLPIYIDLNKSSKN